MINRIIRYISNLIKYIRSGGLVKIHISQINHNQILANKKVIITGGSSGIGYAIAQKFLNEGANVLITGRDINKLEEAKKTLNNPNLHVLAWDVSNFEILDSKLKEAIKILNGLDILINNAGVGLNKKFEAIDYKDWEITIDINLKSLFFISQAVCKYFLENNKDNGGKIINLSSMQAFVSDANPYHISKFGLNAITAGLAKLYTKNNIIVNAIAPGYTATNMTQVNANANAFSESPLNNRIALPEEIAELATFLASNASNNIIGQTIIIDGGQSVL